MSQVHLFKIAQTDAKREGQYKTFQLTANRDLEASLNQLKTMESQAQAIVAGVVHQAPTTGH